MIWVLVFAWAIVPSIGFWKFLEAFLVVTVAGKTTGNW